jgi:hypothetical protein
MFEEGSVYSFTSYNTSHYSDPSHRSQRKVNSYAIEMNEKVQEDNHSLDGVEEGMIALSNYLNGTEEKRPTVSELIGSRINLDDCLKLKLQIRERIRQTKQIRNDLFTSVECLPQQVISKGKPEISPPAITSQTSRISTQSSRAPSPTTTTSSNRVLGNDSNPPSKLSISKSNSKKVENSSPQIQNQSPPRNIPKSLPPTTVATSTAVPPTTISSNPPLPLVVPILSSHHKPPTLLPTDDLADRQLQWLLALEARNRQAKQALEAQTIREVIVIPFTF